MQAEDVVDDGVSPAAERLGKGVLSVVTTDVVVSGLTAAARRRRPSALARGVPLIGSAHAELEVSQQHLRRGGRARETIGFAAKTGPLDSIRGGG
jgi:hypothetical protein